MPKENSYVEKKQKNPITYQNKDVISKIFGENLREKSLAVYGVNIPKIKEVLPTNLPAIEANEMRLDNLFRLEDGSIALVDYESRYKCKDKIKYLGYIVRTLRRKELLEILEKTIRMIVIYTGDVKKGTTDSRLDTGCLQFTVEEVFLSELNGTETEMMLTERIHSEGFLNEEEQMQFVILPLIYPGKKAKQECIRRCFNLAKEIRSAEMQIFLLSGLLVFTDKVIAQEDSERIRRWVRMTKVGRLFEEEKLEALRKLEKEKNQEINLINKEHRQAIRKVKQEKQEAVKDAKRETARQTAKQTARRMLKGGIPITEIQKFITNLSYDEIAELNKN